MTLKAYGLPWVCRVLYSKHGAQGLILKTVYISGLCASAILALGRWTKGSEVQEHPWLHPEFEASLECLRIWGREEEKD